jgi:hypothetical protein
MAVKWLGHLNIMIRRQILDFLAGLVEVVRIGETTSRGRHRNPLKMVVEDFSAAFGKYI